MIAVAGRGVILELVKASLVETLDVPVRGREEAIEARLIGGLGELAVDAQHRLALGHDQAGKVLGEVSPLALVGQEVGVPVDGVLNDLGKLDDAWHEQMLRSPTAPGENRVEQAQSTLF